MTVPDAILLCFQRGNPLDAHHNCSYKSTS